MNAENLAPAGIRSRIAQSVALQRLRYHGPRGNFYYTPIYVHA